MGLPTVAVYSEADRAALHVRQADEAYLLGPAPSRESPTCASTACSTWRRRSGADAVHPGYGFLAENADFARACEQAGIAFIGPRSETIALMGEKTSARPGGHRGGRARGAGHARAGGRCSRHPRRGGADRLPRHAQGRGGRRRQGAAPGDQSAAELERRPTRARSEAQNAFGDVQRLPREGHRAARATSRSRSSPTTTASAVHLFERECSIQRRHQKVIEESPSPFVTPELRERMGRLAVALVKQSATATRAPWSSWWTRRGTPTSWR